MSEDEEVEIIQFPVEENNQELTPEQELAVTKRTLEKSMETIKIKDELIAIQVKANQQLADELMAEKTKKIDEVLSKTPEEWKEEKENLLKTIRNIEMNNLYWLSTIDAIRSLCR
jgi:predicted thioredoxin/glutaredoxin